MTSLADLDKLIQDTVSNFPGSRPLLCNGNPLECDILLVGINPSTSSDFFKYWLQESGFNKTAWLEDYLAKHGKLKPTRSRIEIFEDAVKPLKVVETNVYSSASSRESDLHDLKRNRDFFEKIIGMLSPKLVLCYGKTANLAVEELLGVPIVKGEFLSSSALSFEIRYENHFSYQWSYDAVKQLGKEVVNRYAKISA
ncbi:hypothetical protein ACEV76_09450 [Vibrio parahaemolyticus]|uniref:hypothetical protein n=1 Tax=Vibrio parahaemolyticus TaxID=670 RepID=UPI00111EC945|nr:hypothetical protein [Vibrio parahaemolyticus]EIZ9933130.1 hypothetical protein [Vibrio parahaemolyticus]MBE4368104.1 hypothetical protein [Vibrio parahaemolyticus]TOG07919.1 hypothetical protein CGJ08_24110 [Vibrio parahaemolyticus]TOH96888.1 hypothetical protein CGI69_24330 [Vibrio parahaemolyticus]TOJ32895.1 hypothetical protein CGI40_24870 [Vibrio parahaemolyticus]